MRVFCNLFFARSLGCVLVFSGVLRLFWRVVSYDKTITPPHLNYCIDDMEKIKSLIKVDYEVGTISNLILEDFMKKCGIELVKGEKYCEIKSLIDMYFLHQAPFKEIGNKKNEFPDAIALLSLQSWAEKNNKKLLAVSSDKDWMDFSTDHINVIDDLAKAMDILNKQTNEALDSIIHEIELELSGIQNGRIFESIYSAIENRINIYEIDAASAYNYYIDDEQISLLDVNILTEKDGKKIKGLYR